MRIGPTGVSRGNQRNAELRPGLTSHRAPAPATALPLPRSHYRALPLFRAISRALSCELHQLPMQGKWLSK